MSGGQYRGVRLAILDHPEFQTLSPMGRWTYSARASGQSRARLGACSVTARTVVLNDACELRLELAGPLCTLSIWSAFAGGMTCLGSVTVNARDLRRLDLCLRRAGWQLEHAEAAP